MVAGKLQSNEWNTEGAIEESGGFLLHALIAMLSMFSNGFGSHVYIPPFNTLNELRLILQVSSSKHVF